GRGGGADRGAGPQREPGLDRGDGRAGAGARHRSRAVEPRLGRARGLATRAGPRWGSPHARELTPRASPMTTRASSLPALRAGGSASSPRGSTSLARPATTDAGEPVAASSRQRHPERVAVEGLEPPTRGL